MKNYLLLFLLLALASCQSEPEDNYTELDLLKYGVPVTIMAPDSNTVKSSDLGGVMKDVTIKGEGNYDLQILASSTNSSDIARAKAEALANVKGSRYFSKIIDETADGFVYEMQLDSTQVYYGFRHILLQGDQEIIFSQGMTSTLSQEEAQRIYEAVRKP